jgi:hypothetical protein
MDAENYVDELMLQYCRWLSANGFDRAAIDQILAQRGPELEQWRKETLAKIRRFIDEPFAPTVELQ